MPSSASVVHEFYKVQDEWAQIEKQHQWKLAVWVAEYPDVDIIDKFMDIEQSPIGVFDDIFFRFESVYEGDIEKFEKSLWQEFVSWFQPATQKEMDLNRALFENGILSELFEPDEKLLPNAQNLWKEFLRLKQSIKTPELNFHFCLYFPLVGYNKHNIAEWFKSAIDDVPVGIRLATMDLAQDRRINLKNSNSRPSQYVYLSPKLDMAAAIKNDMKSSSGKSDTIDPHARFRKQVITVMESTTEKINNNTAKEVNVLLSITRQIGSISSIISGLMVAAQAFYAIQDSERSMFYTEEALKKAAEAMKGNDPVGYPIWKSCMLLKAALLYGKKMRRQAIEVYENLAAESANKGDAYYAMESRRLSGHLYYELGDLNNGFGNMLLSLAAGSYIDLSLRRQSTFLHAAYMALFLCSKLKSGEENEELRMQLAEWLGDDWEELLETAGVENAVKKMKTSVFS